LDLRLFLVLLAMHVALSLTPGPAVLCVLSNALARGASKASSATLGICSANGFYFILSATGVSALLIRSYTLFSAVRWIGAGYLLWLGVSILIGKASPLEVTADGAADKSRKRIYMDAVIVQLANPKALLFFTALLPQFLDASRPLGLQMSIIAAVNIGCDALALTMYALIAGQLSRLTERPSLRRLADTAAGLMLITAGVSTARLRS